MCAAHADAAITATMRTPTAKSESGRSMKLATRTPNTKAASTGNVRHRQVGRLVMAVSPVRPDVGAPHVIAKRVVGEFVVFWHRKVTYQDCKRPAHDEEEGERKWPPRTGQQIRRALSN